MKTIIKFILNLMAYFIACVWCLLSYSVKGIIMAPIIGKLGIILSYLGVGLAFRFNRTLFWTIMVCLGILILTASIYCYIDNDQDSEDDSKEFEDTVDNIHISDIFTGLTVNEAKTEYRRLMKIYHPDNGGSGDLSKTLEITTAYSQYMAKHGR